MVSRLSCCLAIIFCFTWKSTQTVSVMFNTLYIGGVRTMGTGGYIVPPKFRTCIPCTSKVKDAAYVKIFEQTTLTTRLYKVHTNLYPPLTKTFRRTCCIYSLQCIDSAFQYAHFLFSCFLLLAFHTLRCCNACARRNHFCP